MLSRTIANLNLNIDRHGVCQSSLINVEKCGPNSVTEDAAHNQSGVDLNVSASFTSTGIAIGLAKATGPSCHPGFCAYFTISLTDPD
jgi:hypothetical protein